VNCQEVNYGVKSAPQINKVTSNALAINKRLTLFPPLCPAIGKWQKRRDISAPEMKRDE
jgi:hypothetical protein